MKLTRRCSYGRIPAAVATGAAAGLIVATAAVWAWTFISAPPHGRTPGPRDVNVASAADLFRLPSGASREMLLVRAGPDASGEPGLGAALFPNDESPREMAAVLLANVSTSDTWDVDLARSPLRCRVGSGWETLQPVSEYVAESAAGGADVTSPFTPAMELRLRSLGGTESAVRLAPGTLRQLLVILPKSRKMDDLTDVQWGDVTLIRDRFDLERLRRFRSDPASSRPTAVPPSPGR